MPLSPSHEQREQHPTVPPTPQQSRVPGWVIGFGLGTVFGIAAATPSPEITPTPAQVRSAKAFDQLDQASQQRIVGYDLPDGINADFSCESSVAVSWQIRQGTTNNEFHAHMGYERMDNIRIAAEGQKITIDTAKDVLYSNPRYADTPNEPKSYEVPYDSAISDKSGIIEYAIGAYGNGVIEVGLWCNKAAYAAFLDSERMERAGPFDFNGVQSPLDSYYPLG